MARKAYKRRVPTGAARPTGKCPPYLSGAPHIDYSIQDLAPKLIGSALCIDDESEAREQLERVVSASFLGRFGGQMAELEAKRDFVARELEGSVKRLLLLRSQEDHMPQWVQAYGVKNDREKDKKVELAYSAWQLRHRIEVPLLFLMMAVTFAASYFTAHSNLVGTGLPVFIETPVAWFMAAMAPLAGFALKLFGNVFRTDRGHHRFMVALFSAAVILAMAWATLFATLYHGLSTDGLGGGLFDEPTFWDGIKDTLFVGVTLLTEITLSATLASRLDRLARLYSPDTWHRNPESIALQEDIGDLLDRVTKLTDRIAALRGDLALFQNSLELQAGMAQLALSSRRARMQNTDLI